jgi:hypothetical protein
MRKNGEALSEGNRKRSLLTVEGIETYYGNIQALKGISFDVPEGPSSRCWVPMEQGSRRPSSPSLVWCHPCVERG